MKAFLYPPHANSRLVRQIQQLWIKEQSSTLLTRLSNILGIVSDTQILHLSSALPLALDKLFLSSLFEAVQQDQQVHAISAISQGLLGYTWVLEGRAARTLLESVASGDLQEPTQRTMQGVLWALQEYVYEICQDRSGAELAVCLLENMELFHHNRLSAQPLVHWHMEISPHLNPLVFVRPEPHSEETLYETCLHR